MCENITDHGPFVPAQDKEGARIIHASALTPFGYRGDMYPFAYVSFQSSFEIRIAGLETLACAPS